MTISIKSIVLAALVGASFIALPAFAGGPTASGGGFTYVGGGGGCTSYGKYAVSIEGMNYDTGTNACHYWDGASNLSPGKRATLVVPNIGGFVSASAAIRSPDGNRPYTMILKVCDGNAKCKSITKDSTLYGAFPGLAQHANVNIPYFKFKHVFLTIVGR